MKLVEKSILIVDDEPEIISCLADILELEGATVTCASNGREALDFITKQNLTFEAIVTDIRMPEMGGIEFLENLNKLNKKPDTFIFISGFSDLSTEEALEQGASAVVNKPFEIEKIIDLCATS